MRNKLRIFFLVLLAMLANTRGIAQDWTQPTAIQDAVYAAYKQNNFAAIDKIGTQLRTEKSRAPSGDWSLFTFYNCLFGAMKDEIAIKSPEQWNKVESKLNRWVASEPQSAVAPIALAYAQSWHAWAFRGEGAADTVTQKQWIQFAQHMALSRRTLEANKKISSVDPQWYVEMLQVATAESWEKKDYLALYEEAMSKEPLYYRTHVIALNRFFPMWGGSVKEIQEFATLAVKHTAATDGKGLYARLYGDVLERIGRKRFFIEPYSDSLWNQTEAGFDDLIKKYPTDWNRNLYAKAACQIGMMHKFKSIARQFKGKPHPEAWPGNYYQICKDHINKMAPSDPLE